MKEPKWLRRDSVLASHERVMREHGGQAGILKPDALDSALAKPKNMWAYEKSSVFALAAGYAKAINQNHAFVDGNKRTALMSAGVFLRINGYRLKASQAEAVRATVGLASGKVSQEQFAQWLEKNSKKLSKQKAKSQGYGVER